MQLKLFPQTADKAKNGTEGTADNSRLLPAAHSAAKRGDKKRKATPALVMEEVASDGNLREAFRKVASNKGAPGIDGASIEEVRQRLPAVLSELNRSLLDGSYRPGEVRRVMIPKAGGGERKLGIPNVIDRIVQQALLEVMQPHFDPTFDESSHGFRPGKSCHTAIAEAKGYVEEGYEWVVDIDLEKFFDTVNHQRLLVTLESQIADRRIVRVIKQLLKAKVVMPDGVVVSNEEGTPQGGPLSPLLSNIVLTELDKKLRERGHKFVRYADDCNIYVRSKKAGQRALESTTRFIEKRLRLKVNQAKSAVAQPKDRSFLGFRLEVDELNGKVDIRLSDKSKRKIDTKIRELTPRGWGQSLDTCIKRINATLIGWIGYFKLCSEQEERTFRGLDAHIRRRLRAIQLKHWKRKRTIVKQLIQLGVKAKTAWKYIYQGRKSFWALSHTPAVDRGLRVAFFTERGLVSLGDRWRSLQPKPNAQMSLAFECP